MVTDFHVTFELQFLCTYWALTYLFRFRIGMKIFLTVMFTNEIKLQHFCEGCFKPKFSLRSKRFPNLRAAKKRKTLPSAFAERTLRKRLLLRTPGVLSAFKIYNRGEKRERKAVIAWRRRFSIHQRKSGLEIKRITFRSQLGIHCPALDVFLVSRLQIVFAKYHVVVG